MFVVRRDRRPLASSGTYGRHTPTGPASADTRSIEVCLLSSRARTDMSQRPDFQPAR
jgi:hypothetical protein